MRLQPQQLINPIVAGTPTPPALPGQQLPDLSERIKRGVEAGRALAQLPGEAQESFARKQAAELAKLISKDTQQRIKDIESSKLSPADKWTQVQSLLQQRGVITTGGSSGQNPLNLPNLGVSAFGKNWWTNPPNMPGTYTGDLPKAPVQGNVQVGQLKDAQGNIIPMAPEPNATPSPSPSPGTPGRYKIHGTGQTPDSTMLETEPGNLPYLPYGYDQNQLSGGIPPAPAYG